MFFHCAVAPLIYTTAVAKKRGESHLTMDHGAVVAASMMAVHHMTTTVSDAVAPGYSFF